MDFTWKYEKQEPQQIKYFLKEKGVSKGLLAKIKFQGGSILVNQQKQNVLFFLNLDDEITIIIPDEQEHETLLCENESLDIVFEDEHFLVINKPAGIASIPAQYHPSGTMANRVKAYYKEQQYKDQVVHVVTRLDRDTSGLMLFAKHGFAHAMLDQELRKKQVTKIYQAIVSGNLQNLANHEIIEKPIGRDYSSLLKRTVSDEGQFSQTEYWLEILTEKNALVSVQLHTGRTHQIRVHFEAIGCPLLGDDMYGGSMNQGITRQALHCCKLEFKHPFTQKNVTLVSPLPNDMKEIIDHLN